MADSTSEVTLHRLKTGFEDTQCVCFLSDGRLVSGHQSTFKLWSNIYCEEISLIQTVTLPTAGDISCICQNPRDKQKLAVSVSSSVVYYDIRALSSPVQVYSYNNDDINEVSFHPSGPYICACDDAGEVKVINTETSKLFKTLCGSHSNLCTCARFLPRKPWGIVSGGMDCKVVKWDFSIPRPIAEVSTQTKIGELNSENMFVNPPMVYSLDSWTSNYYVACGLGNGMIAVYEIRDKEINLKCTSIPHSAMVVSVCCIEQHNNGKESYYVVSGANDSKIVLSEVAEMDGTYNLYIKLVSEIKHSSKINCISVDHAGNVAVADQTNFVTVYRLDM